MERIPLIATSIEFTRHSIIYKVKTSVSGVVVCANDIKNKDLVLRPTIVDRENNEVIFICMHVTPQYYLDIMQGRMKNIEELYVDLENIYAVGDVVGYIPVEKKAIAVTATKLSHPKLF